MRQYVDIRHAWILVVALFITACSMNPLKEAENTEERAYALLGLAAIAAQSAADIVTDDTVDIRVRRSVQIAMRQSRQPIQALDDAAMMYLKVQNEVATGEATPERLAAVAANLERWIDEAGPIIRKLAAAGSQ